MPSNAPPQPVSPHTPITSVDLANASHELRTPLSALLMAVEMLRGTELDNNQRSLLDTAVDATTDLKRLVNQLIETTRVGHLSGEPDIQRVDSYQLLSGCINSLSALAREKAIGLEFWFDPKLPPFIRTDAGRLRQVMNNLVGNAIKHIDRGTVSVNAHLSRMPDGGEAIRLDIIDTGPGIEEDKLRHLFWPGESDDPLHNAIDNQPTRASALSLSSTPPQSSGLGVSITRKLVEQLNGQMHALSTLGSGTTVCVTLPLNVTVIAHGTDHPSQQAMDKTAGVSPRVLLVDDDRLSRVMLAALLNERGIQVIEAEDGEQALHEFAQDTIDLVISDMRMPGMSGTELAQRIRALEEEKNMRPTPLVALTGMVDEQTTSSLLDNGFSETLAKPILVEALLHVVGGLLNPVASPDDNKKP